MKPLIFRCFFVNCYQYSYQIEWRVKHSELVFVKLGQQFGHENIQGTFGVECI